jgi:hypothetical protein
VSRLTFFCSSLTDAHSFYVSLPGLSLGLARLSILLILILHPPTSPIHTAPLPNARYSPLPQSQFTKFILTLPPFPTTNPSLFQLHPAPPQFPPSPHPIPAPNSHNCKTIPACGEHHFPPLAGLSTYASSRDDTEENRMPVEVVLEFMISPSRGEAGNGAKSRWVDGCDHETVFEGDGRAPR